MAKNFSGAGISFGAKDDGLQKAMDSITKKFDTLWGKLGSIADGAVKFGAKFSGAIGGAMGKGKQLVGGLAGALDNMASMANNPKIDKPFDSMYASFHKSFGSMTVGMDIAGKEFTRLRATIGGVAHGLNVGMDDAAKSVLAFKKQGVDLEKLLGTKGLTSSIKQLLKITETFGIEGEQIAVMTSGLTKGFDFTEEGVRKLMGTVFRMGKAFNVGREMMQQMPGIMSHISKETADFIKEVGPADVEKFTRSIVKLSIGFKESLGMNIGDATELAKGLFSTLAENRRAFANALRGTGDEALSGLGKALAEKGGVQKSLEMILSQPAEFMDKLRAMAKKTTEEGGQMGVGFQRLVGVINKSLGSDVTFAMKGNWDKARGAMSQLDAIALNTKKSLTALTDAANKAFKSGRTNGDAYTLMLQQYQTQVMKLSDPALQKWVVNQKAGLKKFHTGLQDVVKKGGPLGKLTEKLLLMQRVGLSGLFTGLGNLGPMLGNVLTQLTPMLSAFAGLGVSLMMVGKLLMPGGILMLGMAMFHKGMRDKIVNGTRNAFMYLKENIPKWWPQIKAGISELWKRAVEGVQWLMEVATPMLRMLAEAIASVDWGALAQRVLNFMGRFIRGVWYGLTGQVSAFAGDSTTEGRFEAAGISVFVAIGKGMLQAAKVVLSNVFSFFFDWSDGFESSLRSKFALIGGAMVVALLFGRTRTLMLEGLAWMVTTFAAKMAIMAGLSTGMFGLIAIAAAGVGIAVGYGIGKIASYYEKSEKVTSGLEDMYKSYANVVKQESDMLAKRQIANASSVSSTQGDLSKKTAQVVTEASIYAAQNQMLSSWKASNQIGSNSSKVTAFIKESYRDSGESIKGSFQDIGTTAIASGQVQVAVAKEVAKANGGITDSIKAAESALQGISSRGIAGAMGKLSIPSTAVGGFGAGLIQDAALQQKFISMVEKTRPKFIDALAGIGETSGEIVNQQRIVNQSVLGFVQALVKSGNVTEASLEGVVAKAFRSRFDLRRIAAASVMAQRAMVGMPGDIPAVMKQRQIEYEAAASKLLKSGRMSAGHWQRLYNDPAAMREALGAAAREKKPTVGMSGIGLSPIASSMAPLPTSGKSPASIIEKRSMVDVSDDTKKVMADVSVRLGDLAQAIRALGDIKVVVSGSPAFERYIMAVKQSKGVGLRRAEANAEQPALTSR